MQRSSGHARRVEDGTWEEENGLPAITVVCALLPDSRMHTHLSKSGAARGNTDVTAVKVESPPNLEADLVQPQ